ncbi:MAG: V/A-type H+-transporting ATPase subunit C [Methanobacteriota archaeon]|jgi:V/A-type H+-transporting ATPase subunit C
MRTGAESGGSSNYEYVAARVRARKAKLFGDDDYRKLVRMSPNEIARFMEESEYSEEINRLGARHEGVDLIEYALYDNMARHFSDIVRWSEGTLRETVVDYLRSYDALNVKTVLRGVFTDAKPDEIRVDLIPAGEIDEGFLESLAELGSVEEVVEELEGTVFGDALEEALREYEDDDVLLPLENAVDRTFYEGLIQGDRVAPESPRGVYRDFLRSEIDVLNVRNALRAAGSEKVDVGEYFIEGGDLFSRSELERHVENREELVEALRGSEYGNELEEAIDELEETGSLVEFDTALDKLLMEFAGSMTNRYPNSVAPVISYILSKEREVQNIRGIARGKEAGLTVEEIEEEIVI